MKDNKYKNCCIGVCYYFPSDYYISNSVCIPLQLGAFESGYCLPIIKDTSGDNRGNEHFYYSEYSGIYWIWKNTDAEYKGIMHHRRFLIDASVDKNKIRSKIRFIKNWFKLIFNSLTISFNDNIECNNHEYMEKIEKMESMLNSEKIRNYDIIAPSPYHFFPNSNKELFNYVIPRFMFKLIDKIINSKYNQYYPYWELTKNSRTLYYANISIMKSIIYDNYCEFVFDVFDELRELLVSEGYYINISTEKSMNRLFGYIGELLTNTFILKAKCEGFKILELPIMINKEASGYQIK